MGQKKGGGETLVDSQILPVEQSDKTVQHTHMLSFIYSFFKKDREWKRVPVGQS